VAFSCPGMVPNPAHQYPEGAYRKPLSSFAQMQVAIERT
jgi:hypothetical protein